VPALLSFSVSKVFSAGTQLEGAGERRRCSYGTSVETHRLSENIVPSGEEKIRFDSLSEDGQSYLACYYAYAASEIAGVLHRQHGYKVRFLEEVLLPT
jgi:hypothetical protein